MLRTFLVLAAGLCVLPLMGQNDADRYRDQDRGTRLEPGMVIPVRTIDPINVNRSDRRVYHAVVARDVRGDNGQLAIPRGSDVELTVRVARDNDLVLDLESVNVNGQRYALRAEPNRQQAEQSGGLVGNIIDQVTGQPDGRAVAIPADAVLNFRLVQPLYMGVADRGVMRDGNHYHDWYNRDDRFNDGYYHRDQQH